MRLAYGDFEFEGELDDLLILAEISKSVRSALGADKKIELVPGQSITLDSFETWDDEDAE